MRARALLVVVVLAAVALLVVGTPGSEAPASRPGSTLEATWTDRDGNGTLEPGPGEPLLDRTELAPASRPVRELATFAQVSDSHVRDEESPGRLTLLDRLGPPFNSTFRPHEALSAQSLAATVSALNGLRLDAVVMTGDITDNAQRNELEAALSALGGGRVDPESGRPGYDGPQTASEPDPFFYRPDADAPRRPGLLERAQRPFRSPGLKAPWFALPGNHDLLFQGELAPGAALQRIATGSRRLVDLSPRARRLARGGERSLAAAGELLRDGGLPGPTVPTPSDPRRALLSPSELARRLRAAGALGPRSQGLESSFDLGPEVRGIALDVVRRDRGSGGVVRAASLAWLRRELRAAGRRRVVVFSHQPLRSAEGGQALLRLLARDPRVVAVVSGHTHRNKIRPFGGLWLVETASLADFPQQSRALRLVRTERGLALETWMVDGRSVPLADTARELAYLDTQGGRVTRASGGRGDRNARLYLSR
ncbi:MAG: metallophosphoesterase [Thermoleophilaceae bacterium]|nr:metallophosphoesterase [Thermoleophilaceae bacterium]